MKRKPSTPANSTITRGMIVYTSRISTVGLPGAGSTAIRDLVKSSPVDFQTAHLPSLPDRYSPRPVFHHARNHRTFRETQDTTPTAEFQAQYRIDITRDINGVGLVYFAAYFSIIDQAILRLWRHLGRSDTSFMTRTVLDHKVCFLGNAEIDSVLDIGVRAWKVVGKPGQEVLDVVIRDRGTRRMLAISTVHLSEEAS